jgi:HEAT repeat protein
MDFDNADEAIRVLTGSDPERRMAAANVLADKGGPEAVPPLIAALADVDHDLARAAVRALGEIGIRHEDADLRAQIAASLMTLVNGTSARSGRIAAETLGRLGNRRAVPELVEALSHDDWTVREAAATALGELGATVVEDRLRAMSLHDPNRAVREAASGALARLAEETRGEAGNSGVVGGFDAR